MKFKKTLRPLQLTAVIFFTISGGPYGLEPLLSHVGPVWAPLLIIVTPIVWCIPVILMVLELNSIMPKEGGYYQWVKSALGERWGFNEGWWSWLYTMTDLAIYPVLFTQYLSFFFPEFAAYKIPICLAIIWIGTALNLFGVISVGRSSMAFGVAVLSPFIFVFIYSMFAHHPVLIVNNTSLMNITFGTFCIGLLNVMWNFLGWDNVFTITEEVESPIRSYLISIFAALSVIVLIYLLAVYASIHSGISAAILEENGFPALGQLVAGQWLGALISAGGMASALGLFIAGLLMISRIPKVMADDKLLPAILSSIHSKTEVPHMSLLICAMVASFMIMWTFTDLLIIDVTLYSAALFPEFIALIKMRKSQPDLQRRFRVPMSDNRLVVLMMFPALCIVLALIGLFTAGSVVHTSVWFAMIAVASGPVIWWGRSKYLKV